MQLSNYSLNLYKIKTHFLKPSLKIFFIDYKPIKNYNASSSFFLLSNETLKQFFKMTIYQNLSVVINSLITYTYYDSSSIKAFLTQKNDLNFIFDLKYYSKFQLNKIKTVSHLKNVEVLYFSLKKLFNYKIVRISSYKCL